MSKEKKGACPTVGAAEQATEPGQASRQAHASRKDFTTVEGISQIQISDFLSVGEENAVPLRYLVGLTGLNSRDLRRRIEAERRQGIAICSNNKTGYYLAGDEQERRQFVSSMLNRAHEIALTAAAVVAGERAEVSDG